MLFVKPWVFSDIYAIKVEGDRWMVVDSDSAEREVRTHDPNPRGSGYTMGPELLIGEWYELDKLSLSNESFDPDNIPNRGFLSYRHGRGNHSSVIGDIISPEAALEYLVDRVPGSSRLSASMIGGVLVACGCPSEFEGSNKGTIHIVRLLELADRELLERMPDHPNLEGGTHKWSWGDDSGHYLYLPDSFGLPRVITAVKERRENFAPIVRGSLADIS